MTDKTAEQPSETALFAALRRTIAHKEFADDKFGADFLAEFFLPAHFRFFLRFKRFRSNTKERLNVFLPGLTEYVIARTAHFDNLFVDALDREVPQIVLLGAGYDTRAYRFANRNRGTQIYELDMAPTQNRKKECLRKARIEVPREVKLVPIDFNTESLADVLAEAGYEPLRETLFVWEGVSYYLDAASVDKTLAFVSHSSPKDSRIAFDYTILISEENVDQYYGAKEFAQTMKEHHADEELMFSIGEGGIESFLEQRGLKLVDHLKNDEIERTYLVGDDGVLLGQITGHFCFVVASKR
jgi:methyltransferase (TIGR00027 family)